MLQRYLWRGLQAGLVAGVVLGLFVALVVNPVVGLAESIAAGDHAGEHATDAHADGEDHAEAGGGEDHAEAGGGEDDHGSTVSLATTKAVSALGGLSWALLLGLVTFGVAFYFLEPALPGAGDTKSYLLAAAGFVTVSGAPWLVLPPQPPGVDQALATDTRLALSGATMVAGLVDCGLALASYSRLRDHGRPLAVLGGLAPFCLLAIPVVLAPANPVEAAVPRTLLTGFRALVLFSQALVWVVLAAAHAWLLRRDGDTETVVGSSRRQPDPAPPAD
jgi:predicted cobalt transporter CbtA